MAKIVKEAPIPMSMMKPVPWRSLAESLPAPGEQVLLAGKANPGVFVLVGWWDHVIHWVKDDAGPFYTLSGAVKESHPLTLANGTQVTGRLVLTPPTPEELPTLKAADVDWLTLGPDGQQHSLGMLSDTGWEPLAWATKADLGIPPESPWFAAEPAAPTPSPVP